VLSTISEAYLHFSLPLNTEGAVPLLTHLPTDRAWCGVYFAVEIGSQIVVECSVLVLERGKGRKDRHLKMGVTPPTPLLLQFFDSSPHSHFLVEEIEV
jgi:hypothetical protein